MNCRFADILGANAGSLTGMALSSLISVGDEASLAAANMATDSLHVTLRFAIGEPSPEAWVCHFGAAAAGLRLLRLAPAGEAGQAGGRLMALEREVAELQQKLAWFREAIDKVGHSVVIFDKQDRMLLYNKFDRDGYRAGDRVLPPEIALEGKTYRELMELRVRYKLHKEFADEPDKFIEDRMRRFEEGGDNITYLATGAIVQSQHRRLADGTRVYIGTNITELVEKEQKQLAAELAYRTKSQFLANMSHELRTPLNAILGFSELIRDAAMGPVDTRYRGYAEDIHTAGQHLLDLINDILDLSKIEVGRMELHETMVDLADVVPECCRLVHDKAREDQTKIELELPENLPCLLADKLRLKQIIINLLSNAIKFTLAGGIVRVAAMTRPDGGMVLSVADTGIGMSDNDITRALVPFQQIDRNARRGRDGTGLGLPLAKTLTELHGAVFTIESAPGLGTTVMVSMPPERVFGRSPEQLRGPVN